MILQGNGACFLGHYNGQAGVAYYNGWKTAQQDNVSPNTDWLVMCGTNAGSQLQLANGVDVGTGTGGTGGPSLFVNAGGTWGPGSGQASDFAIAELVVWPRGLTSEEMHRASNHLMNRIRPPPPAAYPEDMNAWYCPGAFHIASSTWQDCSGNGMTATLSGSGLAESRSAGH
eukprot:scaffold144543_cov154-Phaeocystis_antarctica.AAC.1